MQTTTTTIKRAIGLLALGAAALWPTTVSAAGGVVRGSVRGDSMASGVYTIPTTTGGTLKLAGATTQAATGGGFLLGDLYYVCQLDHSSAYNTNKIFPYNVNDWTQATTAHINGGYSYQRFYVSDYAVNPADNTVYGCAMNVDKSGYNLYTYTFDLQTYDQYCSDVAPLEKQLGAMACDQTGQLYGISGGGELYRVDKTTGALTLVGDTGVAAMAEGGSYPVFHSSAAIDPETGKMFWSVTDQQGQCSLYEVSTSTGAATKLRDFAAGVEVNGLYIAEPEADPGAPAAATDLVAHF